MRNQPRTQYSTAAVESMYTHDLIVRHVKFDVAYPETQAAVGGDVDASDGVVPEPGDGEEVAYGDGDDGAVGADGDGVEEDGDEDCFEEEESQFDAKEKGAEVKLNNTDPSSVTYVSVCAISSGSSGSTTGGGRLRPTPSVV
eukprot:CAMPEP_0201631928 /NCGR_PEP_ID=MMETSP0493-20130528/5733_1 /ASSEMBLY_ACC=CAM_ASM_000838 /TAXON_ID=420259 /ORGANISM="Thalassiosira gravida, Strain GMp14c1" /LENGTH=141 /DNA_ID=CAMNT_0048103351 /DNA_START=694 /DNA_END=1120 /DNA_ORIENTATION=-